MGTRVHGFGIIGCGVIAPFHVAAISDLAEARLVAVADDEPARARELAARHSVDALSVDDLLAHSDVDVVCVCVPSGRHAELGVRAAAAGKHVVVEKPIDVTLAAADRLITACRDSGVVLSVVSQHRWDSGVRELKDLAGSGRLGTLVLADAIVKSYRSQRYYDSGQWRGTWAMDGGGALMNQGVHYVDLLQWVMGPVEQVFARTRTSAHERIEVEDIAAAVLAFAGGGIGVLEATTAAFPGFGERFEVIGTGGTAIVEGGVLTVRELRDEVAEVPDYGRAAPARSGGATGASRLEAAPYAGHREQLRDVLKAIDTGRPPAVDGAEGRKALEIILAVYESARSGRDVRLPLGG